VSFILPHSSDVLFSQWLSHALYNELLKAGVKLYQFRSGILHAKLLVTDDHYIIGSGNFNHRSFFQDLEIDLIGRDKRLLKEISDLQLLYISQSDCIDALDKVGFSGLKTLLARFIAPFKRNF
jgi:cardiolipin synthase